MMAMSLEARLAALAKLDPAGTAVVSVYLDTRWRDEHQRDRTRVFLKNELRRARETAGLAASVEDLAWIEAEGESVVSQARFPGAAGVALFACHAAHVREAWPARLPFTDTFVIGDVPHLVPLAWLLDVAPPALVVFLDGASARLITLEPTGIDEDVALEHEVPGRHSRGGWAQLAQSRYQRHVEVHRSAHFDAVAATIAELVADRPAMRVVLAGEERTVAAFGQRLPRTLSDRVAGTVAGARYEASAVLAGRAADLLARRSREDGDSVEAVLTEAAKGGRAVAGIGPTLQAVNRGAVHRLHVLAGSAVPAAMCRSCGAVQVPEAATCVTCGGDLRRPSGLDAVVDRVIGDGGHVEVVGSHAGLAAAGGLAARLRYPL
jgi:peptide subunit release factor 1 (eRF1)